MKPVANQTLPSENVATPRGEDVRPLAMLAAGVAAGLDRYAFTAEDLELIDNVLADDDHVAEPSRNGA